MNGSMPSRQEMQRFHFGTPAIILLLGQQIPTSSTRLGEDQFLWHSTHRTVGDSDVPEC